MPGSVAKLTCWGVFWARIHPGTAAARRCRPRRPRRGGTAACAARRRSAPGRVARVTQEDGFDVRLRVSVFSNSCGLIR
ncbi:hypothetical protein PR003_g23306 [Phytophthora rubi]|uniref:Uncharacterized protein n=1 Tax=Phytophthora rubi TaxID=129364 RepID=A0A6A3IT10_9STRA|nr:hypothetical protein PR002_g23558 [Phytophthora rubi]KAE8983324.1 hypothetical protein PR001_g23477 [Phytophthora rubi]KAE9298176.1 hypothetical protein PR003_g23306 [Phytophthora rubi]